MSEPAAGEAASGSEGDGLVDLTAVIELARAENMDGRLVAAIRNQLIDALMVEGRLCVRREQVEHWFGIWRSKGTHRQL